jgi:AcrR family transcriptional regulator
MPKLWSDTIETHRRGVHEAILDTAARLASENGLRSLTMSQIAEETGIGRATLYKYFPDVEAILRAWHEEVVQGHLQSLTEVADSAGTPGERLSAVLEAFAAIMQRSRSHEGGLRLLLHRDDHVLQAEHKLRDLLATLLREGVAAGEVRGDVSVDELASFCLHALNAAGELPSGATVESLVSVILAGLQPSAKPG